MSQGYIPRGASHTPTQAEQPTASRPINAGEYEPIEQKNGVHVFAVVWALLSVLAGVVVGASLGVFGFNWGLALTVALSGLFTATCFFAAAAIIERQNRIIELLKELRR